MNDPAFGAAQVAMPEVREAVARWLQPRQKPESSAGSYLMIDEPYPGPPIPVHLGPMPIDHYPLRLSPDDLAALRLP